MKESMKYARKTLKSKILCLLLALSMAFSGISVYAENASNETSDNEQLFGGYG